MSALNHAYFVKILRTAISTNLSSNFSNRWIGRNKEQKKIDWLEPFRNTISELTAYNIYD